MVSGPAAFPFFNCIMVLALLAYCNKYLADFAKSLATIFLLAYCNKYPNFQLQARFLAGLLMQVCSTVKKYAAHLFHWFFFSHNWFFCLLLHWSLWFTVVTRKLLCNILWVSQIFFLCCLLSFSLQIFYIVIFVNSNIPLDLFIYPLIFFLHLDFLSPCPTLVYTLGFLGVFSDQVLVGILKQKFILLPSKCYLLTHFLFVCSCKTWYFFPDKYFIFLSGCLFFRRPVLYLQYYVVASVQFFFS